MTTLLFVLLATATAPPITVCKSTYALCTTATCTAVPGQPSKVTCGCSVHTGYSAATQTCKPVRNTSQGQAIVSRYFPAKAYAVCSNDRPWANCLDSPCIVDKNDPSKAICTCTAVARQGPYVAVASAYNKSMCTTGVISSATVKQSEAITRFLQTQKLLQPYPITILTGP
jgi:hypothetical protein